MVEGHIPKPRTFEIHKDLGPVTNLIAIRRPLSLYGLKANLKAYEPGEVKQMSKVIGPVHVGIKFEGRCQDNNRIEFEDIIDIANGGLSFGSTVNEDAKLQS